jgi:hypothetical protein
MAGLFPDHCEGSQKWFQPKHGSSMSWRSFKVGTSRVKTERRWSNFLKTESERIMLPKTSEPDDADPWGEIGYR